MFIYNTPALHREAHKQPKIVICNVESLPRRLNTELLPVVVVLFRHDDVQVYNDLQSILTVTTPHENVAHVFVTTD